MRALGVERGTRTTRPKDHASDAGAGRHAVRLGVGEYALTLLSDIVQLSRRGASLARRNPENGPYARKVGELP